MKPTSQQRLLLILAKGTLVLPALLLLLLAGCRDSTNRSTTVTVFAAASLTEAFSKLAEDFERQEPEVEVQLNFAGSQQLAQQLAQGAPADLFASANQRQMAVVVEAGRVEALTSRPFASNPMVIVAPPDNPAVSQAIWLSLRTSMASTALAAFFGTPLAYLLARRHLPGRRLLESLLDLPLVLPPAVAGVALLMAFGRRGLIGAGLAELGVELTFTPLAVVLAQLFVASPFFLRAAMVGFSAVDSLIPEA